MNKKARSRIAGATTLIAIMLGSAACGTATPATNIGGQLQAPGTTGPKHPNGGSSADSAERRAAADKARRERADTARWARGTHQENNLKHAGYPGQP